MKKNKWIVVCILAAAMTAGCGTGGSGSASASSAGTVSASSGNAAQAENSESTSYLSSGSESAAEESQASSEVKSASQDIFAMDTYMTVTAYGDKAEEAVTAAKNEINRIDDLLSTGDADSEVAQINANGGGTLSEDTETLLKESLQLYQDTDGVFDITIYPIMQLWGFPTQEYKVPTEQEIKDTLQLVDASKIEYDADKHTISFAKKGMEIDFGGIAKGYTSARVAEIFKSYGIQSGMLNLGGNVQVIGNKTDGSRWRVAIQSPEEDGNYLGVVETADKAVITSGGYERYFEQDGKRYHHIIDPSTGYPADNGVQSSTIVSDNGMLADGLSTSLFIMGPEKAAEFWKAHSDEFEFILLKDDGTLLVSEGLKDSFSTEYQVEYVSR